MTWTYPTATPYVTSHYNLVRRHPVYGYVMPHTGTDYRAPTGTPLRAASAGTVTRSTYTERSGNYVRVDHGGGIWTGYSHLSRRDVAVGQKVAAGQVIGLAGATGAVTAAHLHFEVSIDGLTIDPVPFLAARTTVSAGGGTTPTPAPAPPEDDMAVTIAKLKPQYNDTRIWRGDGIRRTHIPNPVALANLQAMIRAGVIKGDATIHDVDELDWLGAVDAAPAAGAIDYAALAKAVNDDAARRMSA